MYVCNPKRGSLDAVRNDRQLRRFMDDEHVVEVSDVDYRLAIDKPPLFDAIDSMAKNVAIRDVHHKW